MNEKIEYEVRGLAKTSALPQGAQGEARLTLDGLYLSAVLNKITALVGDHEPCLVTITVVIEKERAWS